MTQSPDFPADLLTPFFFRGFLRLLYWSFFKPSAYRDYVAGILGDDADKTGWANFGVALRRPQIVRMLLGSIFLVIVVSAAVDIAIGLLITESFSLLSVAFGVALGVAVGVALGVAFGVALGVAVGVALGVAIGVVGGVVGGVAGGVVGVAFGLAGSVVSGAALGVAFGVAFGIVGMAGGVALSVSSGVVSGVAFGVVVGVALDVVVGVALDVVVGVAVGVGLIAGFVRLPFYVVQLFVSLGLRERDVTRTPPLPALWDELMILPQPWLAARLRAALDNDLSAGLLACGQVICNPFQRWGVQRALHQWLNFHPHRIYRLFDALLREPWPYRTPEFDSQAKQRRQQRDFTTRLIIGELAGRSPIPGINDRLARFATNWLRERQSSPLTDLALVYYQLLVEEAWDNHSLKALKPFRSYSHGEETYQTFRTLDAFLKRTSLRALSTVDAETTWLKTLNSPLRPVTIASLTRLSEIAAYIRTYQASTTATGKRDALTNASLTAAFVRKTAPNIAGPEKILISRIAQQWFDIIAEEQAMLAAPREVRHIRNMYLVGRPVQPDSGHPFVGRSDQFETIDRLWRDATLKPPIVLHGQRRTGKTSILYHLEKNLGASYLTVYANLQSLAAVETTSAFVYNLCDEIARRLRKAGLDLVEPQPADFAVEAFAGLRHFLNQVEDATPPDRWVVVLLDEFEMIEAKITERKIQSDVLYQFRDAMLNRPRFAIVLAGLHTLDQMTRDYWSPFFNGARNVKVSYLDDAAAKLLITNPWDGFELEYDQDALQFIADIAGCQPTLLQAVGAALIDRVNVRLEREGAQYQPRVTQADVDAVLGEVQQTSTYFDAVWHELGENERCILSALAKVQTEWNAPVSRAEINAKVCDQLPQAEIDRAWDLLKQRDMLEDINGQVKFRVELVRRWAANRP